MFGLRLGLCPRNVAQQLCGRQFAPMRQARHILHFSRAPKAALEPCLTEVFVRLRVNGEPIACRANQIVLEALQSAGVLVQSACSGRAVCGLCQVHISGGQASPPTASELHILPYAGQKQQPRLACQMRLTHSVDIVLPKLGLPRGKNNPP
ncbi:hypothetical protein Q3G72_000835 [Acer saccharum]|nr:hypothetical protein Q3G72_000835 [Acer saccharum]